MRTIPANKYEVKWLTNHQLQLCTYITQSIRTNVQKTLEKYVKLILCVLHHFRQSFFERLKFIAEFAEALARESTAEYVELRWNFLTLSLNRWWRAVIQQKKHSSNKKIVDPKRLHHISLLCWFDLTWIWIGKKETNKLLMDIVFANVKSSNVN